MRSVNLLLISSMLISSCSTGVPKKDVVFCVMGETKVICADKDKEFKEILNWLVISPEDIEKLLQD